MKKFVILMILILTKQIALSQTVIIDTVNKTITLSREKKIDVAKIIENEKSLFEENAALKEALAQSEKSNKQLSSDLDFIENQILAKKNEIEKIQSEIIQDKDAVIKQSNNRDVGIYLISSYTAGLDSGAGFGFSYINERLSIGATLNPRQEQPVLKSFSIIVGLKLF